MTRSTADLDTAAAVLEFAGREDRSAGRRRRRPGSCRPRSPGRRCTPSTPSTEAATVWDHGETGMPVAGPGAPLVAEFSVTEFAAAIGLPTEAGKAYLGEAVELRYRLRRVWSRVDQGRPARVAGPPDRPRRPCVLSLEAAAYVDLHVAHVAHKVRPAQVDRLVEEAIGRFMPEEAERRRRQAADGRSFTIDTKQPSLTRHQHRVRGARPRRRPRPRRRRRRRRPGAQGPRLHRHPGRAPGHRRRRPRPPPAHPRPQPHPRRTRTRTARPATATATDDGRPGQTPRPRGRPGSRVRWCCTCTSPTPPWSPAPRWTASSAGSRTPGVRCTPNRSGNGAATPTPTSPCNPVLDLNEHIDVEAYEIRGRLKEQTILTHPTCVFPWCTRPARALEPDEHDADCDHRVPYAKVQHSCSCNAAPLCRRHHRAKTHGRLDLHRPRTRHLRVDQPATATSTSATTTAPSTSPATDTPTRRTPAPTPDPPGRLTPPPRTPPDHHRRGHRHVRGRAGPGHDRRHRLHGREGPGRPFTEPRQARVPDGPR